MRRQFVRFAAHRQAFTNTNIDSADLAFVGLFLLVRQQGSIGRLNGSWWSAHRYGVSRIYLNSIRLPSSP